MKKIFALACMILVVAVLVSSFKKSGDKELYLLSYTERVNRFKEDVSVVLQEIKKDDWNEAATRKKIKTRINTLRDHLLGMDFWFRYLEPIAYRKINGPLPVEWETEVFEKFEKPYKREGAGLTLAELYLEEEDAAKDSLLSLLQSAIDATDTYAADSITVNLKTHHHFYLCNRLFLLNLAAIYTTGFQCPDTSRIIPELRLLLHHVGSIYTSFNEGFPATPVSKEYLSLYDQAIDFLNTQPDEYTRFDHFAFIRNYVNPLFGLNQQAINDYKVISRSFVDYSLNKRSKSIFDKDIYRGQGAKGIFLRVTDGEVLSEIDRVGKLLFYDPILSGNNKRSCISCHKPAEYFTDTIGTSALQYNGKDLLPRNTPSLVNVEYNHLVMLDGQHISLQDQTKAVINNPEEMGGNENEILKKVLSCPDYKKAFQKLLQYTPQEEEITFEHIISAITFYYSKFSKYYAPFDDAMNAKAELPAAAKNGFNLFMGKAQCATCHFVPQFNGVKPPYVGSEFEVLGVPADTAFSRLSDDKGRYNVNPAVETLHAFRTGSLRNIEHTGPYMHNGVFRTMKEVIDFYDAGGGAGRGLPVDNQTLSSDSLRLTKAEKEDIIQFLRSLNENVVFETAPASLPASKNKSLNARKPGGEY